MISIVIIVKNDQRITTLLSTLEEIFKPDKTEVIVVDASDTPFQKMRSDYSWVVWLDYVNNQKKRTFSEQRNLGVRKSKGDIIVFIDADCIPTRDWLKNLVNPILHEKESVVSGAVKPMGTQRYHIMEKHGSYRHEAETMNLAISRKVFEKIGYFDESLEGCEDSDFCLRARNAGYKIRYVPEAIVLHDWGGFLTNVKRSFNGGRDRFFYYRKYPSELFSPSINNIYTWFYMLFVLFLPVTLFLPIYPAVVLVPSIIKKRNPIKEVFNVTFILGLFSGIFN